MDTLTIKHHGAIDGVTGSCHELRLGDDFGILIDCGLFQGAETSGEGADATQLQISFPISHIKALVVTHVHIDHVGRIPYLLAAGFKGPILCSQPSAHLLPLVLEDAVKLGFSRDPALVKRFLGVLQKRVIGLPYKHWFTVLDKNGQRLRVRLQPAGHILGSAYVECDVHQRGQHQRGRSNLKSNYSDPFDAADTATRSRRVVFSGDLGAPHAPLLPAPRSPERCDTLVIESTYGDRMHPDRRTRKAALKAVIERALANQGVVLIPAFSIGRTQEILYELEAIIAQELGRGGPSRPPDSIGALNHNERTRRSASAQASALDWSNLPIIVDSPLAAQFTESYRLLKPFWDEEALATLQKGRDPLNFEQLLTVGSHQEHQRMLRHLQQSNRASVVIAASGMCAGGRIVNYLKALIGEPRTDIVFVGYQARGTPGREILDSQTSGGIQAGRAGRRRSKFGDAEDVREDGGVDVSTVVLEGESQVIRAGIHQLSGYSAHADQQNLLGFVRGMKHKPSEIRLVHGEDAAKQALKRELLQIVPGAKVWIPV